MKKETAKEKREREEYEEFCREQGEKRKKDDMVLSLERACINGWHKKAEQLIMGGVDPNCAYTYYHIDPTHRYFVPVIHRVITKGWTKVIDVLIRHGADFKLKTPDEQVTPLHVAVDYNELDIAALLIKAGADINALDRLGRSPIFYSTTPEAAELLIKGGADIRIRDTHNQSPFEICGLPLVLEVLRNEEKRLNALNFEDELGDSLATPKGRNRGRLKV